MAGHSLSNSNAAGMTFHIHQPNIMSTFATAHEYPNNDRFVVTVYQFY